ncbi:MAG: RNA 2',3'-cyclic phosphodiesterase [Parvularculaceae bacterium]
MTIFFAAISPPDPVVQALSSMLYGIEGARWREPENFHITLSYYGDLDMHQSQSLTDALSRVYLPRFEMQLSGIGNFRNGPHPTSLWVGATLSPALKEVQKATTKAAQTCGIEIESRKFTPHLTLAYLTRRASLLDIAQYKQTHPLLSLPPFSVDCFSLFSSQKTDKRSVYVEEASYLLDPPSTGPT